jgi:hypothetical protein
VQPRARRDVDRRRRDEYGLTAQPMLILGRVDRPAGRQIVIARRGSHLDEIRDLAIRPVISLRIGKDQVVVFPSGLISSAWRPVRTKLP